MNASSESGLWATWMVVIGRKEGSLCDGTCRGERGVDVVPVQEILGEGCGALGRLRGEQAHIERSGACVAALEPCDARREDEPEQMCRTRLQDGVRLGARERGVAAHLPQPPEVVALVEIEGADHLVRGTCHRKEGAYGVLATGFVLRHDAVVEPLGALLRGELADVGRARRGARRRTSRVGRRTDRSGALHVGAI